MLLARVFYVDALRCRRCGSPRKVLAFLTDPDVVARILSHVGLPTSPLPLSPAPMNGAHSVPDEGPVWEETTEDADVWEEETPSGRDPPTR